jgi:4-amino-4-deoxy-L-arabinose transferase-like glycosyltransferase
MTDTPPAPPGRRRDLVLFAAALALLAAALVRQVAVGAPLGPDEAIYASGGRQLVSGVDPSGFGLHRPVGMKVLAAAGLQLGESEWALRAVAVALSLLFLVAYRAMGSRAAGRWPAAWAAAALVTSFGFQRRGGELLSDMPSLLFVVLILHILLRELDRPGEGARPGPLLLAAAPLAAAAFYLRYGVAGAIAGMAAAAAVVWWRPMLAGRRVALAAAALLLLLLLPHVIHSMEETGSALGILEASGDAAHRSYIGQGLVELPLVLALEGGPVLCLLVVVGAVDGWRRLRARRPDERALVFLWLVSVFQILTTGLLAHAEFRYFFIGLCGLALVGARAATAWLTARAEGRRRPAVVAAVLVALTFAATHVYNIRRYQRLSRIRRVEVEAGQLVAAAAAGRRCAVLTSEVPVIGWYSGCAARNLSTRPERLDAERRFVVLFARDRHAARARARLTASYELAPIGRAADRAKSFGDASIDEIRPRR